MSYHIWPPHRRRIKLKVALPTNVLSEAPNLREKTIKVGIISRALTIFRVDEVLFYKATPDEETLLRDLFNYHFTPPYLKKYIPIKRNLRYAGLLPPLKAPAHTTPINLEEALKYRYREGVVLKRKSNYAILDVGMSLLAKAFIKNLIRIRKGDFVLIKLLEIQERYLIGELIHPEEIPFYWRPYLGRTYNSLKELIENEEGTIIGTSKYGKIIYKVLDDLCRDLFKLHETTVIFGSPYRGLYDIAMSEGFDLNTHLKYVVNFIPFQGAQTVRTEEAIFAVLSILNMLVDQRSF